MNILLWVLQVLAALMDKCGKHYSPNSMHWRFT